MSSLFKSLSELLEKVEATKKRLEIIEQTANYLKTLSAEEVEPATNMMVGRAFPKYNQKTLDVSWSTLTQIFERISAFDWDLFRQAMAGTGDIGSATKLSLSRPRQKSKPN
jgi:DNA ligase-1